jgi:hypothetical protein
LLAQDSQSGTGPAGVLILILLIALYFLPTIIAANRHVPNVGSVVVINIFLGWTLIGWIVALAMAAGNAPSKQGLTQPPTSVPPRKDIKPTSAAPTFTLQGERFLFGYTVDPAQYGIWDNQSPGSAVERFPYSEHGKSEGLARYETLEPSAEPFKPLPPTPD